ncbi:LytTR family DNA-binding domain-containing protein [Erysipelothrix urinaevulpis]|uniref:LytTR family DNA-binding domain-containing protein n=1 Tax=Erysipelothrix urinaevulpis TaxID=2683717 RepID=UPI00135CE4AC|nr:LytTR family DNA-binding domain-containing protein [Erysipelothrix urinaevulpis]
MKVKWIHNPDQEDDIVLTYREMNDDVKAILNSLNIREITVSKNQQEYILNLEDILFFETSDGKVFAHTNEHAYLTGSRLYQLIESLPSHFVRVSKGSIINVHKVSGLDKQFSGRMIYFQNSYKTNYVSRQYYPKLKIALDERSFL